MFKSPFGLVAALMILVAAMHRLALANHYYWAIWWYDIIMHFLGGFLTILILLWIDRWRGTALTGTFTQIFLWIMVVGLAWEIYELFFGLTFIDARGYRFDTVLDLIMNTIGASIAYFLFRTKGAPMNIGAP